MIQIIPGVLATSEEQYQSDLSRLSKVEALENAWVHIDFMDNLFVPNKSIGPSVISKYPINLHKEAHLMVRYPLEWVDDLIEAGFERIIFHIEAEEITEKCIEYIKNKRLEVGLAIKNETPIEKIEPFIKRIDVVLVMAVVPGFQGQKFIPETINKIKETSRLRQARLGLRSKGNYNFRIGVDGAVKDDNIRKIVDAGVDFVIVGSYLLKGDIDENLENLWEALRHE